MDRLEEYIRKNRDDLDIYKPSPVLWRRIKEDLNTGKKPARRWLSIAATVAVIIGTSLIFYQIGKMSERRDLLSASGSDGTARQQLKEAEAYYNNQINALYHEATPLLTANPELEQELNSDLLRIDSIYKDLREDLKDNIANQEVVEALIQNYMIRIKILEDMLVILRENDTNGEKNNDYEL
jgi:ABC-type cobalt transport system substrate-binding protein